MTAPGGCQRPPEGWYCSLPDGHCGPCPTYPTAIVSTAITVSYEQTLAMLRDALWNTDEEDASAMVLDARKILTKAGFGR